ncbi:hypothetical protein [Algivirga pacifica]|uniref:Uncharacterized protein n=1 Tax=Algivirga pacifica TaxID=1162670 RepID=A0ABP9DAU7_9BACT
MAMISRKKVPFKVTGLLKDFLEQYNRISPISIQYEDMRRYEEAIPLYDSEGEDTLWLTVIYNPYDRESIHQSLKKIYATLKVDGNIDLLEHLYIDRVDLCAYGNTQPFRVRVVNRINDNFDYFYIKVADASRVYGLELEDILSPNRVNYLVSEQTLIEEHIAGIPGDMFINNYLEDGRQNKIRLAKEFIKFNERCFAQLLGDMHSSNFVVNMIPDFDEINYRIRSIDFDQQCYEGRKNIYFPQFYKQNMPIIELGLGKISPESQQQYQAEERFMIANRFTASGHKVKDLLEVMRQDHLSPKENVVSLRKDLAEHYNHQGYLKCDNMGEIMTEHLEFLLKTAKKYKKVK